MPGPSGARRPACTSRGLWGSGVPTCSAKTGNRRPSPLTSEYLGSFALSQEVKKRRQPDLNHPVFRFKTSKNKPTYYWFCYFCHFTWQNGVRFRPKNTLPRSRCSLLLAMVMKPVGEKGKVASIQLNCGAKEVNWKSFNSWSSKSSSRKKNIYMVSSP